MIQLNFSIFIYIIFWIYHFGYLFYIIISLHLLFLVLSLYKIKKKLFLRIFHKILIYKLIKKKKITFFQKLKYLRQWKKRFYLKVKMRKVLSLKYLKLRRPTRLKRIKRKQVKLHRKSLIFKDIVVRNSQRIFPYEYTYWFEKRFDKITRKKVWHCRWLA